MKRVVCRLLYPRRTRILMLPLDRPLHRSRTLNSSRGITMRRFVAIALSSTLLLQAAPLIAGPAVRGARVGGAQAPVATGAINGTAQSSAGQTLSNYTVHL